MKLIVWLKMSNPKRARILSRESPALLTNAVSKPLIARGQVEMSQSVDLYSGSSQGSREPKAVATRTRTLTRNNPILSALRGGRVEPTLAQDLQADSEVSLTLIDNLLALGSEGDVVGESAPTATVRITKKLRRSCRTPCRQLVMARSCAAARANE